MLQQFLKHIMIFNLRQFSMQWMACYLYCNYEQAYKRSHFFLPHKMLPLCKMYTLYTLVFYHTPEMHIPPTPHQLLTRKGCIDQITNHYRKLNRIWQRTAQKNYVSRSPYNNPSKSRIPLYNVPDPKHYFLLDLTDCEQLMLRTVTFRRKKDCHQMVSTLHFALKSSWIYPFSPKCLTLA